MQTSRGEWDTLVFSGAVAQPLSSVELFRQNGRYHGPKREG